MKGNDPVTLPENTYHALYVQYKNDTLVALGYVSKTAFFDNRYSFSVDITKLPAYYVRTKESGSPVLLLLTPVTVTLDAAGLLLLTPALVEGCTRDENCLR